jgi:hypothetical protein
MARRSQPRNHISVKVTDPRITSGQKSLSLTVLFDAADLETVAKVVEAAIRRHWTCTSITDNRHRTRRR